MKRHIKLNILGILFMLGSCQAFVDNLDGERYACTSDEDCGGLSLVLAMSSAAVLGVDDGQ